MTEFVVQIDVTVKAGSAKEAVEMADNILDRGPRHAVYHRNDTRVRTSVFDEGHFHGTMDWNTGELVQ